MSINVSRKLAKLRDRKCPSCKGPLGDTKKGWSVCEVCMTKACSVCGKISIHGARLSPSGRPLCPRHWSSFLRMRAGQLNLNWKSDFELNEWKKEFQLEAQKDMEAQMGVSDEVIEHIIRGVEIPDEVRKSMMDAMTDEQRMFIRHILDSDE